MRLFKFELLYTHLLSLAALIGMNLLCPVSLVSAQEADSEVILKTLDIAPVWSAHQIGSPVLFTNEPYQYVAYYDYDRFLKLAQRRLDSDEWQYHRFAVQMGWPAGGHAKITLTVDRAGYVHINSYRRGLLQGPPAPPNAIYYRSVRPHSIEEFDRLYMISAEEHPHYPTFYTVGDDLFFTFREGISGRGNQRVNRYIMEERSWVSVFEKPLLDGGDEMNAYVFGPGGPMPGPDGRWHLLWVWRNTPCHSTNHSLSYARTVGSDLNQWESASGKPVAPPFSISNRELLVDGTPPEGGLSNVLFRMNWDSQKRPVISYHKFDKNGYSQIYNARFVDGEWKQIPATAWTYVWGDEYFGGGALNIGSHVRMSEVEPSAAGELTQNVWNRDAGGAVLVLDEETLLPLREERPRPAPAWRRSLSRPESDFEVEPNANLRRVGGRMLVSILSDSGQSADETTSYYLRWEHAGNNRDQPVPKPWPEPVMLRLIKVGTKN